jgi:hypothetical protein
LAFDQILGTFNRSQWERLYAYARGQLAYVDGRILHLAAEQQRIGFLQFSFDSAGKPTGYSTGSPGVSTYIGKLMSAYEVLGGDPFFDLQVRSMANPVHFLKGTHSSSAKVLSNGEPLPQQGKADAPSGNAVRGVKVWLADALARRSKLERKVRRALDYSDSLTEEMAQLQLVRRGVEVEGSLLYLANEIDRLISDPSYRAIADDKGQDPFGKFVNAPFSSYEPGGTRAPTEGVSIERTADGYVRSGNS